MKIKNPLKTIDADISYPSDFISRHNITLASFHIINLCFDDLLNSGITYTFVTHIADIFKSYGFNVTQDNHNVNYCISLKETAS